MNDSVASMYRPAYLLGQLSSQGLGFLGGVLRAHVARCEQATGQLGRVCWLVGWV